MNMQQGHPAQRSVGVEEELLLVDEQSGVPLAVVDAVLASWSAPAHLDPSEPPHTPQLEHEVKAEQIEVISPPFVAIAELVDSIIEGRRIADQAAQRVGARAVALATSVLPVESQLVHSARYEAIRAQSGLTLKEQLTCGFHVHVGVSSEDEGVAVLDRIRPWLATLLALSSNSPFWMGRDTGYASFRSQVWNRWPTAGPYDVFGSAAKYRRTVRSLLGTGVLLDPGMVYFDARLCEHFPTVEIRVADVCTASEHAGAIASLVRGLVETASREWRRGVAPDPTPTTMLRLASWSASRFGVEGTLQDPALGTPRPAAQVVQDLLAHVAPTLTGELELSRVEIALDEILRNGSGAKRQRSTLQRTGSRRAIVAESIEVTNRAA